MKYQWSISAIALGAMLQAVPALAHNHPHLDPEVMKQFEGLLDRPAPSEALAHHDHAVLGVISGGPTAKVTKNLEEAGRGERLEPQGTTDVWAHNRHAYIGSFNTPCGGTSDTAGVNVFYTANKHQPQKLGVILSPDGSRSNDVKVATMNSGEILVHSNEVCGEGGVGGFEIYNVNNPANPEHLASVRIDELNPLTDLLFGGLTDVGVHNLWLFTQGERDYVGVVSEGAFDNFRIYDITDPVNPVLASGWGAEETLDPGIGEEVADINRVLNGALWMLEGFGASQNRFLHDVTVNEAGDRAWLSHWDAGLILLDISDPTDPQLISVAIDPASGSLDGEVNSHAAWPTEDGTIVVETEEDFSAWEGLIPPGSLTLDSDVPGDATIPATAVSTSAGDFFEANQTGLTGTVEGTQVVAGSDSFAAAELSAAPGAPTFADTGTLAGELVWIGQACPGDAILNADAFDAGDIAVVRRGACFFEEKANTAAALGASAVVIANNQPSTPWSGARIWDYSNPEEPVLLSLFDTVCSASTLPGTECNPAGTYSVHNVVVEKDKAYFSWYTDGVVIVDISDPANPVETARWTGAGPAFEEENGGIQDVWGIHKLPGEPWIYASDRNGGLYILKEYGSGSAKNGKSITN